MPSLNRSVCGETRADGGGVNCDPGGLEVKPCFRRPSSESGCERISMEQPVPEANAGGIDFSSFLVRAVGDRGWSVGPAMLPRGWVTDAEKCRTTLPPTVWLGALRVNSGTRQPPARKRIPRVWWCQGVGAASICHHCCNTIHWDSFLGKTCRRPESSRMGFGNLWTWERCHACGPCAVLILAPHQGRSESREANCSLGRSFRVYRHSTQATT